MNNEMKFEKNGLLIPNGALEELGVAGISLSAWLGQDHILLMPQEMTAEQLLHALDGLSQASVELLGVLQEACSCLLYTSPSPRDRSLSRMPSSA